MSDFRGSTEMIDVRGIGCAGVLIRLAAAARTDLATRQLIVWTDDAGAPEELPAWCRMTGHRYVGVLDDYADRHLLTIHPHDNDM